MSEVTDAAIVSALRRQMTIAAAKQGVAAGNLANANTPGYKARELDFSAALNRQLDAAEQMATSHSQHLSGSAAPSVRSKETPGLQARRDGNTVQLDQELLTMVEAAADFNAAQTVLAGKFRLIRYAINEGS